MEGGDLTALVIRALGMILGKIVRDESAVSAITTVSAVSRERRFIPTKLVTAAAQTLIEAHEMDINTEHVTTRRVGKVLTKMRLISYRPAGQGNRGWAISLNDVLRWADSYGLNPSEVAGFDTSILSANGTNDFNGTNGTESKSNRGRSEF